MAEDVDTSVLRLKLDALLEVADEHLEPEQVNGVLLAVFIGRIVGDIGRRGARELLQRVVDENLT